MNYTQVEITAMVLGDQQLRQPCEMGISHDEPEKIDYYEKASAYCPRSHYEFLWSVHRFTIGGAQSPRFRRPARAPWKLHLIPEEGVVNPGWSRQT